MSRYKSNHDCFGNPTEVPGGALLPDDGPALVEQMEARLAAEKDDARHAEVVADYVEQLEALDAGACELRAALEMLWKHYLLPISDEQTAQVRAALGESS